MSKRFFLLFAFVSFFLSSWATPGDVFNANRKQWETLPAKELNRMAVRYMDREEHLDSALLCLSIITTRFQSRPPKGDDQQLYVSALHDTGFLYFTYYGDLLKANVCFLQAQEAAKKYHVKKLLPFIYLNIANLYLADVNVTEWKPDFNKAIDMYRLAFRQAMAEKQWNAVQPIFINMVQVAFGERKINRVRGEIALYGKAAIPAKAFERRFAQGLCQAMQLRQGGQQGEAIRQLRTIQIDTNLPQRQKKTAGTHHPQRPIPCLSLYG